MAKSKRNKVVHLTQVKKKGKDHKEDLIKQIESNVTKFKRIYLFNFDQVKADRILKLRVGLKSLGRIFSGKNSLTSVALKAAGSKSSSDYGQLIEQVSGHRGLLFSDLKKDELVELLASDYPDFCKRLLGFVSLASGDRKSGAVQFVKI